MSERGPKVVVVGGGHGLAATLRAVSTYGEEVTAVVSVADDGGSSGRLRKIAGIPAPGDLRRCLIALAAEPSGPMPPRSVSSSRSARAASAKPSRASRPASVVREPLTPATVTGRLIRAEP